jgi:hypothetical protein
VVQAIEPTPPSGGRYILDTGEVLIDQGRDEQLYGGGSPRIGDLLIVGYEDSRTWYMVVPRIGEGGGGRTCFPLSLTGVDRGDAIDLDVTAAIDQDVGGRLPKTPDFDPGRDTDGRYDEQPHHFCIDERGAIFAWV